MYLRLNCLIKMIPFTAGEPTVYVAGPGGTSVRARVQSLAEGQYTATYTPEAVGRHSVQVTSGSRHVPGSPFTCNVYDVRRVRVTGLGPGGKFVAPFSVLRCFFLGLEESLYSSLSLLCAYWIKKLA